MNLIIERKNLSRFQNDRMKRIIKIEKIKEQKKEFINIFVISEL